MTVAHWDRVKELLHQALPLTPEQRARFLNEACSADNALRAEVESLLLADQDVRSSFLQSAPSADGLGPDKVGIDDRIDLAGVLEAGQVFAQRFQLVRKLGEGGMGQVWLAEQTSPVRRQVALKLIKAGMYDEAVVQRFQSERQSLAIMDHPAIAKVFDAGATPQGQPYFVMEYVPGLPITEYCDQKKLKIRDRLELFVQACDGVQHAHQKAIIHRDLKPANILVVEVDGKPVPRIIDFGLAKATTPQVAGESVFTRMGHFVGTPAYMSPEQADPGFRDGVQDIDTRTDVYSLGVVLYLLLAGLQPFESKQGQKQPLDELLRRLREEEPPPPSAKVAADRDSSSATAAARNTEPRQLAKLLRGDLDWITLKALEKDRARRYASPSELAADIRRHLNHEPVVARPASAGYRLRKYARRHRVAVGGIAGLLLLLTAFSILQAMELRRITRERDRATRITDFMTGMFKVSDPSSARGNSVTAREILDKASNDMGTGLAEDPEVQAQMMYVMGVVYDNLGLYPHAQLLQQKAMEIRQHVLGAEHPDTLKSASNLVYILYHEGHYVEAEKLDRETRAVQSRVLGPEHPDTLASMQNLASILADAGHRDEAEKLDRETLEIRRRVLGPEHPDTLVSMQNLASVLADGGQYTEPERLYRETLDVQTRVLGPEHPDTLRSMHSLAIVLEREGNYAEAEKLDRETLDIKRRILGPEHPDTLGLMNNLANVLKLEDRNTEAEKLYRETLDGRRRVLGPEHPRTLNSMGNLAGILSDEGRYAEAEKLFRETIVLQRRVLGQEHPSTAISTYNLGLVEVHMGRRDEALSLLREAVDHGLPLSGDLDMGTNPDLKSLRGDPRFAALAADAKERAAAAQKPN